MATGTNAIALESEVKSVTGSSGSITTNLCCTKSRAITLGADSSYLSNYNNNLLVKYSDIKKYIEPTRTIKVHVTFIFSSNYNLLHGTGNSLDMWHDYYVKMYFGSPTFEIDTSYVSFHGTPNVYLLSGGSWIVTSDGSYFDRSEALSQKLESNIIALSVNSDSWTARGELSVSGSSISANELIRSNSGGICNSNGTYVQSFNSSTFVPYASVNTSYDLWSDLLPASQVTIGSSIYNVAFVVFENQALADYYMATSGNYSDYEQDSDNDYEYDYY